MQEYAIQQAEGRLLEVSERLKTVGLLAKRRFLLGIHEPEDLTLVMELDAEVERAAAYLKMLKSGHWQP